MEDTTKQEVECLDFFDSIFECIPQSYRKLGQQNESSGPSTDLPMREDAPARSLFEIGERATAKIMHENKINAKKSVDKIKKLTEERQKKMPVVAESDSSDNVEMGEEDGGFSFPEEKEETKKETSSGKNDKKK